MIAVPFKINPYEQSLVEILAELSQQFSGETRFRAITTDKAAETTHTIIGHCVVEKWNDNSRTWEEHERSPIFTVKSENIAGIENSGAVKSMIKLLIFATKAMNIPLDLSYEREEKKSVVAKYASVPSWEAELKKHNISAVDIAQYTSIRPLKKFFEEKGLLELFDALHTAVKRKYKREHVSNRMFREFVWGGKISRAAKTLTNSRPARRKEAQNTKHVSEIETPVVQQQQSERDVVKVVEKLKRLGLTKTTFGEKFPALAAKYGSLSNFAANSTDNELLEAYGAE